LLARDDVERAARCTAATAAVAALALGASTLGEYVGGWDLGIDQALFIETAGTIGTSHPGRMSPTSSLCFLFLAAALLAAGQLRFERLKQPIVAGLGASVVAIGVLALLGYVLEVGFGYHLWNDTGTAVHSATGFVLLGSGLLALVRSEGRLRWSLEPANRRRSRAGAAGHPAPWRQGVGRREAR
jgi:peptidoglycan/LPS O-acetylase OafA/YrhL